MTKTRSSQVATGVERLDRRAVALTPRVAWLLGRFGVTPVILAGLLSHAAAYALLRSIGVDSSYAAVMLPTFLLVGLGFGLAFGPLNIAATNGVAPEEQGLASRLVTSSFQIGGAAAEPAYAEQRASR
jgi:hypothetical protein